MFQMTKFMCHKVWGKETIVKKAFSPFLTMLSKGLFPRVVKSRGCVEKSEGLICLLYMTPFKSVPHLLTDNIYIWPLTPCINYSIYLQITITAFQLFISTTCINLFIIYSKIICLYLFKDYLSISIQRLFVYQFIYSIIYLSFLSTYCSIYVFVTCQAKRDHLRTFNRAF